MTEGDEVDDLLSPLKMTEGDEVPDLSKSGSSGSSGSEVDDLEAFLTKLGVDPSSTKGMAIIGKFKEAKADAVLASIIATSPHKSKKKGPKGLGLFGSSDSEDDVDDPYLQPRVGGKDKTGVWTGCGRMKGQEPYGTDCYRDFYNGRDQTVGRARVEKACCYALGSKYHDPLFSLSTEANPKYTLIEALKIVENYMIQKGMDGVFTIYSASGDKINMFTEIGKLSKDLVTKWVDSLLSGGYTGVAGTYRGACLYDRQNLLWSGVALEQVASTNMHRSIELAVPDRDDRTGPRILYEMVILSKLSTHSLVRDLCNQLKTFKLTDVAGEDMATHVLNLNTVMDQIKSHCSKDLPADLAEIALGTVVCATDTVLQQAAKQLLLDQGGKTTDQCLHHLTELCNKLKSNNIYAPMQSTTPTAKAAFQAQVETQIKGLNSKLDKLIQTGRTPAPPADDGSGNGAPKLIQHDGRRPTDTCTKCGNKGHWACDSSCPLYKPAPDGGGKPRQKSAKEKKILAAIEAFTMPENYPDTKKLEIELDGEIVAQHCKRCNHWKTGRTMHWTAEHKTKAEIAAANLGQVSFPSDPVTSIRETDAAGNMAVAPTPTGVFDLAGADYELDFGEVDFG